MSVEEEEGGTGNGEGRDFAVAALALSLSLSLLFFVLGMLSAESCTDCMFLFHFASSSAFVLAALSPTGPLCVFRNDSRREPTG